MSYCYGHQALNIRISLVQIPSSYLIRLQSYEYLCCLIFYVYFCFLLPICACISISHLPTLASMEYTCNTNVYEPDVTEKCRRVCIGIDWKIRIFGMFGEFPFCYSDGRTAIIGLVNSATWMGEQFVFWPCVL